MEPFQVRLTVRGYELDSYKHVNHAMYLSYLEHARWKLLEEEDIHLSTFEVWKAWPVVASLEVKYLRPALMGEELTIATDVVELGKADIVFSQLITKGDTRILQARVQAVMINERGRPCRIPEPMLAKWGGA